MTIVTARYVRKPLFVDAVRITKENFNEIAGWCQGTIVDREPESPHIKVRVHQPKNVRQMKAYVGDWLLYSEYGYKIYTDRAFQNSFAPAPQE